MLPFTYLIVPWKIDVTSIDLLLPDAFSDSFGYNGNWPVLYVIMDLLNSNYTYDTPSSYLSLKIYFVI